MAAEFGPLMAVTVVAARVLFKIFETYFGAAEKIFGVLFPDYKKHPIISQLLQETSNPPLDERIKKIDAARENLKDAIAAIDSLRVQADANKRDLADALNRIAEAEQQKEKLSGELEVLRQVAEVDTALFRKVVGLPSKGDIWRERLFGFGLGILASIIASVIFILLQKLYGWIWPVPATLPMG